MKPVDKLEYAMRMLTQRPVAIAAACEAIRATIGNIEKLEHDLAIARAANGLARAELLGAAKISATFPPLEGDA